MKNILIFIFAALLLSIPAAMSQGTGKYRLKTSVGFLAGGNYNTMTGKDFVGQRLENNPHPGYHVGVNIQIPFLEVVYFQPGLNFTTKGTRENNPDEDRVRLTYLEVPMHVVYKSRLPDGFFYLGAGPYVAYGLQALILTDSGGRDRKTEILFKNVVEPEDQVVARYLRRMDAGAGAIIGYEMYGGLFLQFNVQFGIMKINPEYTMLPDNERELRNAGIGLSLGFRL